MKNCTLNSPTMADGSPSSMAKLDILRWFKWLHIGDCSDKFYKKTQ